jgi:hypothetical protein
VTDCSFVTAAALAGFLEHGENMVHFVFFVFFTLSNQTCEEKNERNAFVVASNDQKNTNFFVIE